MNEETRRWVDLAALQLAGLVVAVHLAWGLDRLAGQLRHGVYVDPRPLAFVLSSMAVIAGVAYVALGGRRVPVYALGIALMLVYVFGYWAWHLVGHVPAMPWVETQTDPHPGWGPVETLVRHLAADPLALFSKVVELGLALVLGVLWYGERGGGRAPAEAGDSSDTGDPPAAASEPSSGGSDPTADSTLDPTPEAAVEPDGGDPHEQQSAADRP